MRGRADMFLTMNHTLLFEKTIAILRIFDETKALDYLGTHPVLLGALSTVPGGIIPRFSKLLAVRISM